MMRTDLRAFVCQQCGACCRVPGVVRVTSSDIDRLAAHLGLSVETFIADYTDLSPSRTGLILKGEKDGPCIFLTANNQCQVHVARPQQCRDYPERWRSDEIEAVCKAIRK
jgi:Fe-S-cluster containining protein